MPLNCDTGVGAATQLLWVRLAALLLIVVAFCVAMFGASMPPGTLTYWCIFCWVFSFTGTLLVVLVEVLGLQDRLPVSWPNFQITIAHYACLLCISASRIPFVPFKYQVYDNVHQYLLMSKLVSGLAAIAFVRVIRLSEVTTAPGRMSVFQTFVACIILMIVSDPVVYNSHVALQWCMAVYCICFILSMAVVVLYVAGRTDCQSTIASKLLPAYGLLAVIMYATAAVIWPMFRYQTTHLLSTEMIIVAVLTAINFLLYLMDLAFTAKRVFCGAREERRKQRNSGHMLRDGEQK
ncbi:myeloid-associated differentiation marker homolog [Pempheris klunzingeri]|uniref:myeloid-associated differentiation marker homolog n=1 Tax=Pempheris klunzingeri TaxID=3127111 RepID=UPI00397EB622